MKRILIVAGDYPYPPIHGGRVDIWNRIKVLKSLGLLIDLAVTTKDVDENRKFDKEIHRYIENFFVIKRKNRLQDLFSFNPLQVESRKKLSKIEFKDKYDLLILEGDYVGAILDNNTLKYNKLILRLHNNEIIYFNNLAKSTSNLLKKMYYYSDSLKFLRYEKQLIKRVKNIMFISYDEKERYDSEIPIINSVFLPATVNLNLKKQKLENKNVVAIGSLFMDNNKEGLVWYINNIHSKVTESVEGYKLIIAGNSNGGSISWLRNLASNYNNIIIYDTPESLDEIYALGSVFINPMLHGAGVKLKTIEAIVNGLPVVSTTIGNEGTGLVPSRDILVTDDAQEYANYIVRLLEDESGEKQKIIKSAQEFIEKNYNTEIILDKYLKSLDIK